jgi:hypothetical protein
VLSFSFASLGEKPALNILTLREDVEKGGRYDARSAAINLWSHHWQHPATHHDSALLGTFYFAWGDAPRLWEIETEDGFTLEDLMQELGQIELKALGYVKHGDVPKEDG